MDSNVENILRNMIDGTVEYDPPRSRVEEALVELKETLDAGKGGGTIDEVARNRINTHADNSTIHVSEAEKAAWNGKANQVDFESHAGDMFAHTTEKEKEKINNAVDINIFNAAVSGFRLDIGQLDNHAENTDIHVTAEEKAAWNGKADLSDIPTSLPANGGNAMTANHQIQHYLSNGTDVLEFAITESCPSNVNTKIRIMNCPTCPTNYGYDGQDNDFWYDIYKLDSKYITIKAYDIRTNFEYTKSCLNGNWSDWIRCSDYGNADTLDGKHASEFIPFLGLITDVTFLNNAGYAFPYECTVPDSHTADMGLPAWWWHIKYFHNAAGDFGCQMAIPVNNTNLLPCYRTSFAFTWDAWKNFADGGNAASVGTYTEDKIAALEARIAALENGV